MSSEKNPKIIIPARLNAQRLPGKPLMDIQGRPMVIRVAEKCIAAVGNDNVIVSTPDAEIADTCQTFGVKALISSMDCLSGTDRLFEYMNKSKDDLIINVQGDEPMIPISVVRDFYNHVLKMRETCVGISQIFDEKLISNKSVVKVAFSDREMIYASREPIGVTNDLGDRVYFKHTGLYSFTRNDIMKFGSFIRGSLETAENVEILRLVERGIKVKVLEIPNYGRAVDTIDDFTFVNKYGQFGTALD